MYRHNLALDTLPLENVLFAFTLVAYKSWLTTDPQQCSSLLQQPSFPPPQQCVPVSQQKKETYDTFRTIRELVLLWPHSEPWPITLHTSLSAKLETCIYGILGEEPLGCGRATTMLNIVKAGMMAFNICEALLVCGCNRKGIYEKWRNKVVFIGWRCLPNYVG